MNILNIDSEKGLNLEKFQDFLVKIEFLCKFILKIESQPLMKKGRSPKHG